MGKKNNKTCGFGVPDVASPHQFIVNIPSKRSNPVEIWEDFGISSANGYGKICRVEIPRDIWRCVATGIERHLKQRLKENSIKVSRFSVGENQVERILGREISVLGWAIEDATAEEASIALTRWSAHRPEELWWLFQQIDMDGGERHGLKHGWRLAIRYAFITEEVKITKSTQESKKSLVPSLPNFLD